MNCLLCGAKVNGTVCNDCINKLQRNLGDVRAISEALVVTYTRQGRTGTGVGSRSTEKPVPFDERASTAAATLRNTLTTWVRDLEPTYADDPRRDVTTPALADWMLAHMADVRRHHALVEICQDMARSMGKARRAVDRAPEKWYAGTCEQNGCKGELYADPTKSEVSCPLCGWTWDVAERRKWLLAEAEDRLARPFMIAAALTSLGNPVTPDRIRKWVFDKRLMAHSVDLDGQALYRVGDVIDLLTQEAQRAGRRQRRAG